MQILRLKAYILASCLFLFVTTLFAQKAGDKYINSLDVIRKGIEYYESGQYDQSTTEFIKVLQGDSLYALAQYELALAYVADSQDVKAVDVLRTLLNDPYCDRMNSLLLVGAAYERLERYDEAMASYDQAISEFGNSHRPYFEKAGSLNQQKKYKESLEQYILSLRINPYHSATHLNIGFLAADAGEPTLAILALFMGITTSSNSERNLAVLGAIENIGTDQFQKTRADVPAQIFSFASELDEIDEVVKSKSALTKKYKSLIKLDLTYAKQLQVICELLPTTMDNNNPILQFYQQFYKKAWDSGHFVGMATLPMGSINAPAAQKLANKNKSKGEKYREFATNFLETHNNPIEITYLGKKEKTRVHWTNATVSAFGELQNNQPEGYWRYFSPNGNLSAEGNYAQGKKTGVWKYYHENGRLKQSETNNPEKDDQFEEKYNEMGIINTRVELNASTTGKIYSYNENGTLNYEASIKEGKTIGPVIYYDQFGAKSIEFELTPTGINGMRKEYYPEGQIKSEAKLVDNDYQDVYTSYHSNGKIDTKGNFVKGKKEGEWLYYFENGQIYTKGSFKSDRKTGTWYTYTEKGMLAEEENYGSSGELEGMTKVYDIEGKILREIEYKKDKAITMTHYNTDGSTLAQVKMKDNVLNGEFYNSIRVKAYEGRIEKKSFDGPYKEFDAVGNLILTANYKGGFLDGSQKKYYSTGQLRADEFYVDGEMDGLQIYYHKNGQVSGYYYYDNGMSHGPQTSFYVNGNKSTESFYWKDKINGLKTVYAPDGTKDFADIFEMDLLCGNTTYDANGKILHSCYMKEGNGVYHSKYRNGADHVKIECKNGNMFGSRKDKNPDGSDEQVSTMLAGYINGHFESYNLNHKTQVGEFKYGRRTGVWDFYEIDGTKDFTAVYHNGQQDSLSTFYYRDGKVRRTLEIEDGDRHGVEYIYGDDGSIAIVRKYYRDKLIAYTYEDKNHKLLPFIPVNEESDEVKAYYANGKLSASFKIKNSEYDGTLSFYYPSGKLMAEYSYINGSYQGTLKEYSSSGVLLDESVYVDNEMTGVRNVYHPNGKLMMQLTYVAGTLHGPVKLYDKNGKLTKEGEYYNDTFYAK
ncbi:MAG: hypothetical protein IPP69_15280 [Flavobacteriales bacterium]|nr:hypothetical protein [Flavobacteriales bacterium]